MSLIINKLIAMAGFVDALPYLPKVLFCLWRVDLQERPNLLCRV